MTIGDEFRKVLRAEKPEQNMFVPMLRWFSGYEKNIEFIQAINSRFSTVNTSILNTQLVLNNHLKHFISYPPPKAKKEAKDDFFYKDICKYFGWTMREFNLNRDVVNIEEMKEVIATSFAYDNVQRKVIGLKKLEGFKNVRR